MFRCRFDRIEHIQHQRLHSLVVAHLVPTVGVGVVVGVFEDIQVGGAAVVHHGYFQTLGKPHVAVFVLPRLWLHQVGCRGQYHFARVEQRLFRYLEVGGIRCLSRNPYAFVCCHNSFPPYIISCANVTLNLVAPDKPTVLRTYFLYATCLPCTVSLYSVAVKSLTDIGL